jgi:hypothetical protein
VAIFVARIDIVTRRTAVRRAIEIDGAKIENYAVRASVHEAQGKIELALDDLHKAVELKPKNVFDTLAQAAARKHADELAIRAPCGTTGRNVNCL